MVRGRRRCPVPARLRIAYARVSTSSGEQLSALERQLAWLREQGPDLVLTDVESGLELQRESYQVLLGHIEAGRACEVLATALSRLGRDAAEADRCIALCDAQGCAVTTRDEGRLTLATPEDLLLTRIRSSLAQGESMRLSVRIKAGLAQGRKAGRPMRQPPWAYRLSADRSRLEPHPEQWLQARALITALEANGWRMQPVLTAMAPGQRPFQSVRGLRAWLLNPILRGGIGYNQQRNHRFIEVRWGCHEPLLTAGQFDDMQTRIEANRKLWGVHADKRLRALTGLLRCSECSRVLGYIPGRVHPGLKCRSDVCSQRYKSVREQVVVGWILEQLPPLVAEQLAREAAGEPPAEAAELERQLQALEALQDPDLADAIETKRQRLQQLQQQVTAPEALRQALLDPLWWQQLNGEETITLLHQIVEVVVIQQQRPVALRLKPRWRQAPVLP